MSTIQEARYLSHPRPQVDVPPWLKEAKAAVKDFAEPNALIYWADLLLTLTVGYACAVGYLDMSGLSWQRVLCYVGAVFAIFRATSFVHEIVHMRAIACARSRSGGTCCAASRCYSRRSPTGIIWIITTATLMAPIKMASTLRSASIHRARSATFFFSRWRGPFWSCCDS